MYSAPLLRIFFSDLRFFSLYISPSRDTPERYRHSITNRFSIFRADFTAGERACGGVAILIKYSLFYEHVKLNTELQAVVIHMFLPVRVAVCS